MAQVRLLLYVKPPRDEAAPFLHVRLSTIFSSQTLLLRQSRVQMIDQMKKKKRRRS